MRHCEVSKVLSPFAVDVVLETLQWWRKTYVNFHWVLVISGTVAPTYRMISVQLKAVHQDAVGAFVQV